MKRWKVEGMRTVPVYRFVEAETEDEAWEKAGEEDEFAWDVDGEKLGMYEYPPRVDNVEEVE